MRVRFRAPAITILAAVLLLGAIVPVAAASRPRLPRDAGDWATFTPAEKQAAIQYQLDIFDPAKADWVFFGNGGPTALAATWTASCGFLVSNATSGSYVRSDAITDANFVASRIYARSEFYRDTTFLEAPVQDVTNRSRAEAVSGTNFAWWFEQPTYRVKSWHRAAESGTWVGSERFCDYSWTKP